MIELTTKDSPIRVTVYERDKRILVNRPDALIVLCFCGGTKSIVHHVQASDAKLPPLKQCRCDEEVPELSVDINNVEKMLTTDGKVERMYVRLKEGE